MHTTIAAAADWQYEASLSEANFQYFWLVTTLQENEKKLSFCGGSLYVGPPVRPNMLRLEQGWECHLCRVIPNGM